MQNDATTLNRFHTIPAVIFGCLYPGELKVIILPGVGLADGGILWDIPVNIIPIDCRIPNTLLWIKLNKELNIVRIWRREES